jgi:hypothetical protein
MSHKSPLALVKETFGDKSKLVEAIKKLGDGMWIPRVNEEKGLDHVSNAKLLRLHATFSEIKEKFGTREKLIEAVLEQQSRTKDVGLRTKLGLWPVPRLYDTYRSNAKRLSDAKSKAAPEKAKADPAKTKAAPAKAKVAQTRKS